MKLREQLDKKKAEDKNENRRLAALSFVEEQAKMRELAAQKAKDQGLRRA